MRPGILLLSLLVGPSPNRPPCVLGGGTLRTCVLRPPGIYGPEEQRHLPRVAVRPRPRAGAGTGASGVGPRVPASLRGAVFPAAALSSRRRQSPSGPPCVPGPRPWWGDVEHGPPEAEGRLLPPPGHGLPEVWVAHPCRKPSPEKARHRKDACPAGGQRPRPRTRGGEGWQRESRQGPAGELPEGFPEEATPVPFGRRRRN